jgi:peptide/nickel transport system substrate-binding protein
MKRLFTFLVVLLLVCSSVLMGCGTPSSTATAPAAPASAAPTVPAAPTAPASTAPAPAASTAPVSDTSTPKSGGILRIRENLPPDMPFGDPLFIFGPMTNRASIALERLLLPGSNPGSFKYVLATGITLAPDKSYYDISLRQGVKFHDGTDFNAAAVKWNLDRVKAAVPPFLSKVSSIEVKDANTVRLRLSSWDNRIINDLMAQTWGFMISPAAFEKNGADWIKTHPVGTGPFVFKEVKNNQVVVFEKNTNYWDKGLPYLDGVETHIIMDEMVAGAALQKGEVDITDSLDVPTAAKIRDNPNFKIHLGNLDMCGIFCMNTVDPSSPWSDVRMRQALEYALDKETIAKAMSSYAAPIYNVIKGLENNIDEKDIVPRKHDLAKAKELLAVAGHPNGLTFNCYIEAAAVQGPFHNVTIVMQQQLAEAGFIMNIQPVERAKIIEISQGPMTGSDMRMDGLIGNSATPIEPVMNFLGDDSGQYKGVKRPAEWPGLLEKALQTTDPQESLRILEQMDKLAYDDAMILPTTSVVMPDAVNARVQNLDWGMMGFNLSRTWLSK